jgi:RNA 2'-phosphotransferase, Tpt1 / KptA family
MFSRGGLHSLRHPLLSRTSAPLTAVRSYKKKLVPVIDLQGHYKLVDIREAGKKEYRKITEQQFMTMLPSEQRHALRVEAKKKLKGPATDSFDVKISKTLSWLLRHGAKSEGLDMRPDGYIRVSDVVRSYMASRSSPVQYTNLVEQQALSFCVGLHNITENRERGP